MFDERGRFLFKFGSKGSHDGQFNQPWGVAIDVERDDRIIVADPNNHRVQVFSSRGEFLFKFGSHGDGEGQFNHPTGVGVTRRGIIIVSQWNNHCVQMFDESGHFLFQFGGCGSGDLQFNHPNGVVVGSEGRIIVADWGKNRVQVVEVVPIEWSVRNHWKFPIGIRKAVEAVLMLWRREGDGWNVIGNLPLEVVHMIVQEVVTMW